MANVYSQLLVVAHNIATGAPLLPPAVPAGYIWVIRDIAAWNGQTIGFSVQGLMIEDTTNSAPFFQTPAMLSWSQTLYHLECRQVMPTGYELVAHTNSANWNVRISGYALTTP